MVVIDKLEVDLEVQLDNLQKWFKKAELIARDTWKKLDKETLIKYEVDLSELKIAKDAARKLLREAKAWYDKWLIDKKQVIEAQRAFDRLSSSTTEASRRLQNYKNTWEASLSRLQKKFNDVNWWAKKLLSTLWQYIWLATVWRAFTWALNKSIDDFREFETAFTGFRKTLDATEPQLKSIEQGIIDMSKWMPKTVEELSHIAEVWGQMWIAADDILTFTKVVAQLSTSIDWISADEAAQTLARLQAQTWWSIENLDRLWASLVDLWNNFKTNEWEILNFANEIKAAWWIVVGAWE